MRRRTGYPTWDFLKKFGPEYKCIIVGDADMAPPELLNRNGAIHYFYYNDVPGMEWLTRIRDHFKKTVWFNPCPTYVWPRTDTVEMVQEVFPMYELTVGGLTEGIREAHALETPPQDRSGDLPRPKMVYPDLSWNVHWGSLLTMHSVSTMRISLNPPRDTSPQKPPPGNRKRSAYRSTLKQRKRYRLRVREQKRS